MIRSGEHVLWDAYMATGPARGHWSVIAHLAAKAAATLNRAMAELAEGLWRGGWPS